MPLKSSRASITLQRYSVYYGVSPWRLAQNDPAHTAGSRNDLTSCGVYCTLCLLACQQIFFYSKYFLQNFYKLSVEMAGFEPATFALQRRCSPTELHPQDVRRAGSSGLDRIRTCDPCVISTVL